MNNGSERATLAALAPPEPTISELKEALSACIPWLASSGRGAAQEALAIACKLVGSDPFDWSSHPDVLASRIELLGWPDRRQGERLERRKGDSGTGGLRPDHPKDSDSGGSA